MRYRLSLTALTLMLALTAALVIGVGGDAQRMAAEVNRAGGVASFAPSD